MWVLSLVPFPRWCCETFPRSSLVTKGPVLLEQTQLFAEKAFLLFVVTAWVRAWRGTCRHSWRP